MKKRILLFSFILFLNFVNAQVLQNNKSLSEKNETIFSKSPSGVVRCATHEFHLQKQKKGLIPSDEEFEKWIAPKVAEIQKQRAEGKMMLPSVIRIPVVVHVIHNGTAKVENITDAQVLSQITVLNNDYRKIAGSPGAGAGVDTTIEFCMAAVDPSGNATSGIVRHQIVPYTNTVTATADDWETQDDIELAKTNTIWDPTKYLNMWTFRFGGNTLANGGVSDLLGYAQFPSGSGLAGMPTADCISGEASTDGLVMAYGTFGSRAIYPAGTYTGTQYDQGRTATHEIGHALGLRHIWGDKNDCTGDDFCADVPPCSGQYYAAEATCLKPVQCSGQARQTQNYMDYSDDTCMNMFTQNQKDRMLAVLQNSPRRDDLLVSPVCNAPTSSIQFKRIDCSTRIMNIDVNEGSSNVCGGYNEYTVPLSISKAPTQNAVVTFSIDGTSTASASDISIQTPTVTFPAGVTTDRNLVFRILNDALIETNEDLIISFTVNANGGDAFAHAEGNKLKVTILNNNDIAPATNYTYSLISEDFEDATGWTTLDGNGDGVNWGLIGADGIGTAPNTLTGTCAYSQRVNNQINNYFISPQVTIPTGANSINLSYIIGGYGGTAAGNYTVYFATNVTSATNINAGTVLQAASTVTGATNGATILKNHSLLGLAGQTGYIVFRHSNSNTATAPYLLLDNVELSVNVNTQVQTTSNVGTQFSSNIPADGTFVAYDTNAFPRAIMAEITSTTNFNYGCTTVAVTRDQASAGAPAVNYGSNTANNLKVMAKRITVGSANVPPATQNYDNESSKIAATGTVKFYFTEAEIAAWETATGNSRASLRIIKDGVNTPFATTLATFGTHTSLEANITDGIGGVYYFGSAATLSNQAFEFDDFALYPNPNNGSFSVKLNSDSNKISVKVFDIRGREIFNNNYSNSGLFNQTIQLNNIQQGVYLVNITDGLRKTTRRIVIE